MTQSTVHLLGKHLYFCQNCHQKIIQIYSFRSQGALLHLCLFISSIKSTTFGIIFQSWIIQETVTSLPLQLSLKMQKTLKASFSLQPHQAAAEPVLVILGDLSRY